MSECCLREGTEWRHGRISALAPNSKRFARVLHVGLCVDQRPFPQWLAAPLALVWEAAEDQISSGVPGELGLFLGVVGQCDEGDKPQEPQPESGGVTSIVAFYLAMIPVEITHDRENVTSVSHSIGSHVYLVLLLEQQCSSACLQNM